jgi:hypothetical protein
MSLSVSDILRNADTFRAAYPSWPHPEPEERPMGDSDSGTRSTACSCGAAGFHSCTAAERAAGRREHERNAVTNGEAGD